AGIVPLACKCPAGSGQIHTSAQAGGIASERIRFSSSLVSMMSPVANRQRKPWPACSRRIPGMESETYLRPTDQADPAGSPGSLEGCPSAGSLDELFRINRLVLINASSRLDLGQPGLPIILVHFTCPGSVRQIRPIVRGKMGCTGEFFACYVRHQC